MMIDTSLLTLDDAVEKGKTLSTDMRVILPSGEKADIYGFIAIDNDLLSHAIDMPPLGKCHVLSNRVVFSLDEYLLRYPIFNSVSKVSEEKYNLYLLYLPKFTNLSNDWNRNAYINAMQNEIVKNSNVAKLDGVIIEDSIAYYFPNDYDLYFTSKSKLRGIGTGFAVITRRISKLTDNIYYEIFDSHGVRIESNEDSQM